MLPVITQTTVSLPRTGVEHRVFRFSACPRIPITGSDEVWYSVTTSAQVYLATCWLFHHICIPSKCPLYLTTSTCTGSVLHCRGSSENSPPRKPLHSVDANTCLLFIYPHQGPSPHLIRDHQSVSYWPNTGSFW